MPYDHASRGNPAGHAVARSRRYISSTRSCGILMRNGVGTPIVRVWPAASWSATGVDLCWVGRHLLAETATVNGQHSAGHEGPVDGDQVRNSARDVPRLADSA